MYHSEIIYATDQIESRDNSHTRIVKTAIFREIEEI